MNSGVRIYIGVGRESYAKDEYPDNRFGAHSGLIQVLLGEFASCVNGWPPGCSQTQDYVTSLIDKNVQQAHASGFAMAFWKWDCADSSGSKYSIFFIKHNVDE
jgi:hypothetical protein